MLVFLKMDEEQILTFLKKLVSDYEGKRLTEEEKKVVSEFYMELNFVRDETERSSREMMNYLFLGWFIHNTMKSSKK